MNAVTVISHRQNNGNNKMQIMKIKPELKYASILAAVALAGYSASLASVPAFQGVAASVQAGGTGTDCPGPYTAVITLTNSAGSIWITPPAGETNAILTDVSPYPVPYASVVSAMRRIDGMYWCAGDSVTFPVDGTDKYQMKLYVVSGTVTNGQPLTLQITYQP